jgi:hypothetical protein
MHGEYPPVAEGQSLGGVRLAAISSARIDRSILARHVASAPSGSATDSFN